MFTLPYLFSALGRNALKTRLIQLLKQFERNASLGFTLQDWPLPSGPVWPLDDKKEFQRELIFAQNGVNAFKTEPLPMIDASVIQKFHQILLSNDHVYDKNRIHFILNTTSNDQLDEKDIRDHLKPWTSLNDTSIVILAWMRSQSTVTLLASTTLDEYATFGSALMSKNLEIFAPFHFYQMYSVNFCTPNINDKPPNILIYTGNSEQSGEEFRKSKEILGQCLDQDKYVIYQLKHDLVMSHPWKESTCLLVLVTDQEMENSYKNMINDYVENGGRLLSFCAQYSLNAALRKYGITQVSQDINISKNLDCAVETLRIKCIDAAFEAEKSNAVKTLAVNSSTSQAVIISVLHGVGMAVLSLPNLLHGETYKQADKRTELLKNMLNYLGLTCGELKKSLLTKAYLLGSEQNTKEFLRSIDGLLVDGCFKGNDIKLVFTCSEDSEEVCPSFSLLPVITSVSAEQVSFSFPLFQEWLETEHLGRILIYSEVVTSTQTILNGSLKLVQTLNRCGLVIVGRQQTLGKGRGGNDWLSPDGCLSFSFHLQVNLDSRLGSRIPFIQHMSALAVTEAVRSITNYENVDIRIKWPNDIYFGNNTKIGGILVNSSVQGKILHAVIGIGVNLDNSEPTTCINDILERENQLHGRNLKQLSREQLLARILNSMEILLEDFQQNGPKKFLLKYHRRWLHSNAVVTLERHNGEQVTVKGLDDMGFLSVINRSNEVISVQPDGNSFDMMRNLIAIKARQ